MEMFGLQGFADRIRRLDVYKRVEDDFISTTVHGGAISILAVVFMVLLFLLEFGSYLAITNSTSIEIDDSLEGTFHINFDLNFPNLPCELASLDVSDVLHRHEVNVTKSIRMSRIDEKGRKIAKVMDTTIEHDAYFLPPDQNSDLKAKSLDNTNFDDEIKKYKIALVNYYAPWCGWSRRLAPIWERAAEEISQKPYGSDVLFARVDCTDQNYKTNAHKLCHRAHIPAFPWIVMYEHGETHSHRTYQGERKVESIVNAVEGALTMFISKEEEDVMLKKAQAEEQLAEEAHQHAEGEHTHTNAVSTVVKSDVHKMALEKAKNALLTWTRPLGCSLAGHLRVGRVPGNIHVSAHSLQHTVSDVALNVSHTIRQLTFSDADDEEEVKVRKAVATGKLAGRSFVSEEGNSTIEHYLKVVSVLHKPYKGKVAKAYEYSSSSHTFKSKEMAVAQFSFDLSPIQVVTQENSMPFYSFITSVCAILGGTFTVLGLLDGIVDKSLRSLKKKMELGKQN
mmetsp:Transcript_39270/g.100646  ORF Transcript_39270/g.100646 Transcript_39270/m.100646 type:complete len:508 (-) Transcript_39270:922-2445(-)